MSDIQKDYQKMWEDVGGDSGDSYLDIKFKPTYRIGLTNYLRENQIYDFLQANNNDVVLDIACASGRQLFKIQDKIKTGYGLDIAKKFIDKAEEYKQKMGYQNLNFSVALIEDMPFENNFFNKIICAEVLEHVFDKDIALQEVKRVLKPGGILVISVPNMNADATWWGRFLRKIGKRKFISLEHFSQDELKKHGDSHVREYTKESLCNWLEANGFSVVDIKSASFIDGPYMDWLLKVPLHTGFLRKLIINFEKYLTDKNYFYGRHLVLKAKKK